MRIILGRIRGAGSTALMGENPNIQKKTGIRKAVLEDSALGAGAVIFKRRFSRKGISEDHYKCFTLPRRDEKIIQKERGQKMPR